MENIPIDIHIPKLLGWLISRKISVTNWQDQAFIIREKINNALQDMPERKDITELLSGTYINYFHCCRIVEILKETEADTKNLFGWYGSQRMKDWVEIIRLYQKDTVYLAEAANLLFKTVKYEIPSMRKEIAKSKQNEQDCEKKFADYEKSIQSGYRELKWLYKQYEITGKNVRTELLEGVKYLDGVYKKMLSDIGSLKKPLQYYTEFSHKVNDTHVELTMINFLIEQYKTECLQKIESDSINVLEMSTTEDDIKLGITDDENEEQTIDWGELEADQVQEQAIDWGEVEVDQAQVEEDIDWEIEVENNDQETDVNDIVVEVEDSKQIAAKTGNYPYAQLDTPKNRELFITDLLELQSFLKVRVLEANNGNNDVLNLNSEFEENPKHINSMLDDISNIQNAFSNSKVEQLHFIKHSSKYVDKIVALFNQKTINLEKMLASQQAVKILAEESTTNVLRLTPKLKLIIAKTRELKTQIEEDISKRYNNRPVHLIGGF